MTNPEPGEMGDKTLLVLHSFYSKINRKNKEKKKG
jgi:hypothetical protein